MPDVFIIFNVDCICAGMSLKKISFYTNHFQLLAILVELFDYNICSYLGFKWFKIKNAGGHLNLQSCLQVLKAVQPIKFIVLSFKFAPNLRELSIAYFVSFCFLFLVKFTSSSFFNLQYIF